MAEAKYKFALDSTSLREPGSKYPTHVHRGEAWYADHPFVVANPQLFSDIHPDPKPRGWQAQGEVETATAAPGEKRTTNRGKK